MSKPYSDFPLEVFGNDFQNCNYLSKATSSWRTFSLKKGFFSQSSSVSKQNFSRFSVKILQQSWQKCILYVQRNNWWKTNLLKKSILLNSYGFSAICFWDLTSFNRVAKTSHYLPNQPFVEKNFFEQKFTYRICFGLRVKSFSRIFEHFPMFTEEVFLEKRHFFSKNHVFSRLLQKKFLADNW